MPEIRELYETNDDVKRYIDAYCEHYINGIRIPISEAMEHKIVRSVVEWIVGDKPE